MEPLKLVTAYCNLAVEPAVAVLKLKGSTIGHPVGDAQLRRDTRGLIFLKKSGATVFYIVDAAADPVLGNIGNADIGGCIFSIKEQPRVDGVPFKFRYRRQANVRRIIGLA